MKGNFRRHRTRMKRTRRWDDRGVSMLEFAGFLPVLLVIGMAAIQLGLIGYGINQAGRGHGQLHERDHNTGTEWRQALPR